MSLSMSRASGRPRTGRKALAGLAAAAVALTGALSVTMLNAPSGDATIQRGPSGLYNLGYVGVGSQILPDVDELMLAVGGNLDLSHADTTELHVGHPTSPLGRYIVQGEINPSSKVTVGTETPYDLSGTPANNFGAAVVDGYSQIAALSETGEVTPPADQWSPLVLTGSGSGSPQVSNVPGSIFADLPAWPVLDINNVDEDTAIVINVTPALERPRARKRHTG